MTLLFSDDMELKKVVLSFSDDMELKKVLDSVWAIVPVWVTIGTRAPTMCLAFASYLSFHLTHPTILPW